VREALVELGLKPLLNFIVGDSHPGLHRFPDEHKCDLAGSRVIEPDLFRQERDAVEVFEQSFSQSPDLVVDLHELIDVRWVDREDEYFNRKPLTMAVGETLFVHAESLFTTQRRLRPPRRRWIA
jgi:hypothetical protein